MEIIVGRDTATSRLKLTVSSEDLPIEKGALAANFQGTGTAELTYTDFLRNEKKVNSVRSVISPRFVTEIVFHLFRASP